MTTPDRGSAAGRTRWLDTHVHVSNYDGGGMDRGDILGDLLEVIERSGADLRFVLSGDVPWVNRMKQSGDQVLAQNAFIHDLVRRAPGQLYGACTVNPHFPSDSRKAMRVCFEEWGFVLLGEMLPYLMDYHMNTDVVVDLARAASEYGVPVQVHISTSNAGPQGPFPGGGTEQLEDLMDLAERVPEATYILAHFIGTEQDNPPVVDGYLDQIERRYGEFPPNFRAEIRDFNSPGVVTALQRIPGECLVAGTDWVTRVGPPFLPYGVVFGTADAERNPYEPGVAAMVQFLTAAGASDAQIAGIGFDHAAQLLGLADASTAHARTDTTLTG